MTHTHIRIKNMNVSGETHHSLDMFSLFTNIPPNETVCFPCKSMHSTCRYIHNLPKKDNSHTYSKCPLQLQQRDLPIERWCNNGTTLRLRINGLPFSKTKKTIG